MLRTPIVACFIASTALACAPPSFPVSSEHPLLGQKLPDIGHHETVLGNTFDDSQLRGHPAFFKFFAEYCEPCKETLPAFQKLHKKHRDVRFVGVNEDESRAPALELTRKFGLTFPVIRDRDKVLSDKFGVDMLPTSFACDASGIVRWVGTPNQSERDLKRAVAALR